MFVALSQKADTNKRHFATNRIVPVLVVAVAVSVAVAVEVSAVIA